MKGRFNLPLYYFLLMLYAVVMAFNTSVSRPVAYEDVIILALEYDLRYDLSE